MAKKKNLCTADKANDEEIGRGEGKGEENEDKDNGDDEEVGGSEGIGEEDMDKDNGEGVGGRLPDKDVALLKRNGEPVNAGIEGGGHCDGKVVKLLFHRQVVQAKIVARIN